VLTVEDWRIVRFYERVADQFFKAPMGVEKGAVPLTPRLEGYEAALRLYGYPESEWEFLVDGAVMLHRLVRKLDKVMWEFELGKPESAVRPEDVS
jgi:hypothetical protein